MKTIDFYSGFEGHPEVVISRRDHSGEVLEQIRLWEGFFSDIIDAIPLGESGAWEGISAHYQLETGWLESHRPWEYADFRLFLSQLESLDTSLFKFGTLPVFEAIRNLVRECKRSGHRLFIEQD